MALDNYRRSTDERRLFQDANVEVTDSLYPPHFDSVEDADIGDNDPDKVGAIATVMDDGVAKVAVYQGGGVWKITGGSGEIPSIDDNTLTFDETSSTLNGRYPDMPIGGIAYNATDGVSYTKKTPANWVMEYFI